MAAPQRLEIEMPGGTVRGELHRPVNANAETAAPAVLICRGIHVPGEDALGFLDDVVQSLCECGCAAAIFEHRCAELILDDFDAHSAVHDAQDALAALHWMLQQPGIDAHRIGVCGYSLGAVAATALARHQRQIARVCLVSAATADFVHQSLAKRNGHANGFNPSELPASYVPSLESIDSAQELAAFDRPTLILHGAADALVPPEISQTYADALQGKRNIAERILIARGDHTFSDPSCRQSCLEQIATFFGQLSKIAAPLPETALAR